MFIHEIFIACFPHSFFTRAILSCPNSISLCFLMSLHVDTSPLCNALLCLSEAAGILLPSILPWVLFESLWQSFTPVSLLGWVPHPPLAAWKKVLTPCSGLLYSL